MFGIDSGELLIIAIVALVVIGPKDLPRVMRSIGNFAAKARGMARHFRSGVDTMIRESELADMDKKWQADNERIMREHPLALPGADPVAGPGEAWPEPVPELAAPVRLAKAGSDRSRPRSDRPKPPPRAATGARPAAGAPPIPTQAPPLAAPPPADESA